MVPPIDSSPFVNFLPSNNLAAITSTGYELEPNLTHFNYWLYPISTHDSSNLYTMECLDSKFYMVEWEI